MNFAEASIVVGRTAAAAIAPVEKEGIVAWAESNITVIDGPFAGDKYSLEHTPYIGEILECGDPDHPCNEVCIRKSAQTGLSTVMMVLAGYAIKYHPSNSMLIQPTDGDARDFAQDKFQPLIEASPPLKKLVRDQRAGTGKGSTSMTKRFPGGYLILTGANSPSALSSKTIRLGYYDEVDRWPAEVGDDGDPEELADGRFMAYRQTGDWKKFKISTPLIKGVSRIDAGFEAGDMRFYHVPCPHCGGEFRFHFDKNNKIFHFRTKKPYEPFFSCPHCGSEIKEHQKKSMVASGRWVPTNPGPGREPSFHVDVFISPFVPWDDIVDKFLKARDNPVKLKAFYNLYLGLPWEEKGDAPDYQRLYTRREEYRLKSIPPGGLFLTAGADVQANGIYYEVVAWGPGGTSYGIDYGFLTGDTSDRTGPVWADLTQVYMRRYPDAYGNSWGIEKFAVDSGFNTNAVYSWARRMPNALAIKGADGWQAPAITRKPSPQDVGYDGKVIKNGVNLWHVGTWGLKSEFYANLDKKGCKEGEHDNPPGYCFFCEGHEIDFFKQITSEYLKKTVKANGREVHSWRQSGPNHLLDCRIYAMAAAEHLGLSLMDENDWRNLMQTREIPDDQGDLFLAASRLYEDPASAEAGVEKEPEDVRTAPSSRADDFLGNIRDNWI